MKPKLQIIHPPSIPSAASLGAIKVWLTYSFAPEWFKDALNEARTGSDHHSRRREILFAVCCVESYLFEWTRDEVLNRNFDELEEYFPYGRKMGIKDRWKHTIKHLKKNDRISNSPDFGDSCWQDFCNLVVYRDGLVHGRSSRPETSSQGNDQKPVPSKTELDQLPPGWAVKIVILLIRDLHKAVGTSTPQWLIEP
jgi:hypothetical protein